MKKIIILLLIILLCGCNYRELDKIAITIGCGIEKIDDEYKITLQIADTQKQGESNNSSSPVRFKNYSYTEKTIHEAARSILTKLPKRTYNNHMQVLIIDEKIAKEGIEDIIDIWFREVELRNDFYVFVSKDATPTEVLGVLTQIYPINSVGIKNLLENNNKFLGGSIPTTFEEFTNEFVSETKEIILPVITVIGKEGNKKENLESSIPESLLLLEQTAIFKDNKLVDYLNKTETIYYNIIKSDIETTVISYECDQNKYVTIELLNTKTDIKIKKNNPEINLKIKTKGNLTSTMCNYDITKEKGIKEIENETSKEIKKQIENVINISKKNKTDIFYFRDLYYKKNTKYYKKISNYDDFYENLKINVEVDLEIIEKGSSLKVIENEKNNQH